MTGRRRAEASSKSSQPTRPISGRSASASAAPTAVRLLVAKKAVGGDVGLEHLDNGVARSGRMMQTEPCRLIDDRDAGVGQRRPVPGEPLARRVDVEGNVADQGNSPVACGQQMLDGEMGTSLVLEQDGVGGQAHRRAIEEDHRHPVVDLPLQELVVLAGAGDQQAVDPAADEAVDDVPLPPWIVVGAHGDQQMPLGERGVLDEAGDRRVERVGHVGDDETDRRRPGCPTQRARPIVTAVAEHAHGSLHAGGDVVAHEWLLVDDSRDGLDAHTGDRRQRP